MARAALHLNDAGITLLDSDRILYRQPGYALLGEDGLVTGDAAFSRARINPRHVHHRYWKDLATAALKDRFFTHLTAADLASRQLEDLWKQAPDGIDELVVAAPAWFSAEQLGLILGVAAELGLPVVAMADAAVAATRRGYRGAVPAHVDVALHATTLTRIAQDGEDSRVERAETLEGCGLFALHDAWLKAVAEAFVRQSRFDPLHKAETEQLLLDQLGAWLAEAGRSDVVALAVDAGGVTHRAEIESLTLLAAAGPCYQQIANRLRALYRADETPAIQLTDRAARLPGLADMLTARVGGETYVLEAGATARGALARCRPGSGQGVTLQRRLPWDQSAVEVEAKLLASAHAGVPTHLLHGDVAWRIDDEPLVIGAVAEDGARHIALAGDMPGVSRRHCEVRRDNGQCIVEDASRFGTFLNGHRIDGSTVLQVGDSLRVGTPGYEFRLITTDESHGT